MTQLQQNQKASALIRDLGLRDTIVRAKQLFVESRRREAPPRRKDQIVLLTDSLKLVDKAEFQLEAEGLGKLEVLNMLAALYRFEANIRLQLSNAHKKDVNFDAAEENLVHAVRALGREGFTHVRRYHIILRDSGNQNAANRAGEQAEKAFKNSEDIYLTLFDLRIEKKRTLSYR